MDTCKTIIDSHAHCGIQDRSFAQSFEAYLNHSRGSGIETVVMFPPVMEIYDRYDPGFKDTPLWQTRRKKANDHLLTLGSDELRVIPYLFIWNDFAVNDITEQHKGIKWHRHADEPVYRYDTASCRKAVAEIKRRNMPVVLEEEYHNTVMFIETLAPDIRVIIPHLGGLNGGYSAICSSGLWDRSNVYADTALASTREITHYIETYGCQRLLFGSDFPFGDPRDELMKIKRLNLPLPLETAILGGNVTRLLSKSNTGKA